jgi:hypothetical protein
MLVLPVATPGFDSIPSIRFNELDSDFHQSSLYPRFRDLIEAASHRELHFVCYTRQIEAADRFFQLLKSWLKTAGLQEQHEILIERPVWLVEAAPP